jgi:DNA-binding XRE family transcriptional regulator
MIKRPAFETFKKTAMQDEAFKTEYKLLQSEFELIQKFIKARKKARYSQLELAQRLKLQQPAIARLEKGGYTTTSVAQLSRIADALGYSIKISLAPKKRK